MRTRLFMLLAIMLIGSASAMAQSNTIDPARGDVNGDGIVDVADINAILKIMRDNGGLAPQETTYYWYAGNDPQENTSTITVATGTNPGWRKIDKSLENVAEYTSSNPLWHGENNPINTGFTTVGSYLYLPKVYVDAGLGAYVGDGNALLDNTYQKTSRQTITISSIVYYEYFKSGVMTQFGGIIYKK